MKIALAFWGLTRSLKYTIDSINNNILKVLNDNSIEYIIYQHTYYFSTEYKNIRTKELNDKLDFDEYKLLNANYLKRDDQDKIKLNLNLQKYRSFPDPWRTNYNSVDNFILAMYSKKKVTKMIQKSKENIDIIMFLRPDVKYLRPFDINFLNIINNTINVPNFGIINNINDRACIALYKEAMIYGKLFNYIFEYSKNNKLHSEEFQYNILTKLNININYISFYFNRVRCNGLELINDYKKYPLII